MVAPLLVALTLLVVAGQVSGDPAALASFYRWEILTARSLAAIACVVAAMQFRRGDYLRRAWLILLFDFLLLVAYDVTRTVWREDQLLRLIFIAGANAALVGGLGTFADAGRRAGIELAGSRTQRIIILVVAVVVAAVLGGGALWDEVRHTTDPIRLTANAASDLGDMAALVLIAPLGFTGLALSGGVLAWPFVLLTLSRLMWLGFDAMGFLSPRIGLSGAPARAVEEVFRTAGCLYVVAAALAHWLAMRDVRAAAAEDQRT